MTLAIDCSIVLIGEDCLWTCRNSLPPERDTIAGSNGSGAGRMFVAGLACFGGLPFAAAASTKLWRLVGWIEGETLVGGCCPVTFDCATLTVDLTGGRLG